MPTSPTLDWNDLRYLLAAVRQGSLAGAARELGVKHSTVGRRLAVLEQALGGALVLRQPTGLVMTPLGERVAQAAEQVDRAMSDVLAAVAGAQPRVRLAVPTGFADLFAAQLSRLDSEDVPVLLEFISGAAAVDLTRGDADLAVRVGPVGDEGLVARPLGQVGWTLFGAESYLREAAPIVDPTDLRGHRLVGFDPALNHLPAARWLDSHGTGARVVIRSREMVDMAASAASGAGLALLPCHLGHAISSLQRLTDQVLVTRDLWLVYRREARRSATMQAAIQFVIAVTQELADLLSGQRPKRDPADDGSRGTDSAAQRKPSPPAA